MSREELQAWMAALETGYLRAPTWVPWAEARLQAADPVPPWLVDLYEARETRDAVVALCEGLRDVARTHGPQATSAPIDDVALRLGLLYLRHERGDFSLAELLRRAGEVTDGANYDRPDCEALYSLLNEIDAGGPTRPSLVPLAERVRELLAAHAALARRAVGHLRDAAV